MQVKSIAEPSAILLTFIKQPLVIKIFVLSIFEWPFYTGFTVFQITKYTFDVIYIKVLMVGRKNIHNLLKHC